MEKEKRGRIFTFGIVTGLFIASLVVLLAVLCMKAQGTTLVTHENSSKEQSLQPVTVHESIVNDETVEKLGALEQMIYQYYYEDVDEATLEKGLYYGLMGAIGDPYTCYYTSEEVEELSKSLEGIYFGIGAYLSMDYTTGYSQIDGLIPDTPAETSGLQVGDIIYKVDGEDMKGMSLTEVVSHVKGPENTDVTLTVMRSTGTLDIVVTRKKIESPTVKYEMLDSGIVHMEITEFDEVTEAQYNQAMTEIMEQNPKGMILDLRGNPGGSLSTVVAIAEKILPKGMIVYTEDKYGKRSEYECDGTSPLNLPLVVLADGNSASASEILVGAIQDHGVGTIVGTQTYGKGIVQRIFPLDDGSALKITVSNYYTPNGNNIHGVGITPDVVVEFDSEAYKADKTDNQLNKAIEIMQEKISSSEEN